MCPRNGLCHSCAYGRVAGEVGLPESAGRLGFVAAVVVVAGRRARPLLDGVFRGTFWGKGHTGKCSPKRDLRFGVLRTALGAISNKKQQIMHKNTVLDPGAAYWRRAPLSVRACVAGGVVWLLGSAGRPGFVAAR